MLINLSNHPSTKWTENQIKLALTLYFEIIDLNFPLISPSFDSETVKSIAEDYSQQCIKIFKSSDSQTNAIHIMGEMTFVYAFVKIIEKKGIECIASTTERIVTEFDNSSKISQFNFVRFRSYY